MVQNSPFRRQFGVSLKSDAGSSSLPSNPGSYPGECAPGVCGMEAACQNLENGTHTCLCPHDASLPTKDLKCPNRRTVPITPRAIYNIIPPTNTNVSLNSSSPPKLIIDGNTSIKSYEEKWLIGASAFGAAMLLLFLLLLIIVLIRRKYTALCLKRPKKSTQNTITISTNKNLLEPERYLPNPQYTPCPLQTFPLVDRESLTFLHDIGQGFFGKVFKGVLRSENIDDQTVAIKVLKESASKESEEDFMREVEIMSIFRHPNILTLIGVVPKEGTNSPCMVFEFMPYGDLTGVLRGNSKHFWKANSNTPTLTKEGLISVALQISAGMRYLASQRFVHRDLACRNCLVGENLLVKIADFGMSRDVYTSDYYKVGGSRLLPIRWMSPESIFHGTFTLESDVWSYGVVLWEVFSYGKQPYYGRSNEEVLNLIKQGQDTNLLPPPEDCPVPIYEIMKLCWKTKPRERTNFPDIYERLTIFMNQFQEQAKIEALPRPPAFPIGLSRKISSEDILDSENYLQPQGGTREYFQPLPD